MGVLFARKSSPHLLHAAPICEIKGYFFNGNTGVDEQAHVLRSNKTASTVACEQQLASAS
jgi:hypothetical protein